jgi:uncharacterized membrane protein YdjX (TVP38/TMEM64 family)
MDNDQIPQNDQVQRPANGAGETRFQKLKSILFRMDEKRLRTLWISLVLLALTGVILILGQTEIGKGLVAQAEGFLGQWRDTPFGLLIVIILFCMAAFVGAPQFVLIALTVVIFGPWQGFWYSWIATIASAAVTFGLGRKLGPGLFRLLRLNDSDILPSSWQGRTFAASLIIRNVPSAPFVIVNMAFGLAKAPFRSFILGCAFGIVPKTALVASLGSSSQALMKGEGIVNALLVLAGSAAWLWLVLFLRRGLKSSWALFTK